MSKLTFEEIRERGLLLFEYIRGSQVYGTATPQSDEDHGGVFICPQECLLGLHSDYIEEVSDSKHDTVWWELGRFLQLALTSNPTVLEALFIPDEYVLFEHPLFRELRSRRDMFLTKACFNPFGGYAVAQIQKARGQNKKVHWEMEGMTRKTPMDFCYTFNGQGSMPMEEWLAERGLEQRNCGLVNIPNMPGVYGVYYDFGQHFRLHGYEAGHIAIWSSLPVILREFIISYKPKDMLLPVWLDVNSIPKGGYCGIMSESGDSNEVRFSSVAKDEEPICYMTYNQNGYETHCKRWKEYEDWRKNRNVARYESNMEGERSGDPDLKFDSKNMSQCFRLIHMCTDVAKGEGMNVDRRGRDADFLLDVRNRKYGYTELMSMLEKDKEEMDEVREESTLPDSISRDFVSDIIQKNINSYAIYLDK